MLRPRGIEHALSQLDELQACIGERLDALIWHEAEMAKLAERRAHWATRLAVSLVIISGLGCVYSLRS